MKDKKLKLGIWSSVSVVVILAIAVAANILIGKLNVSWDMTPKSIYTISDQTKSILKGLEQDVTLYVLDSEDAVPTDYKQILQQYTKYSKHIEILYRDQNLYPGFASNYTSDTTINTDSIIVECGENNVYLDSADFTDISAGSSYSSYEITYELEGLLTSAINTVNDGETLVIYQTTGHDELTLSSSFQNGLMKDNYSLEDLSLLTVSEVPEDASVVLINAPLNDFSEDECQKLREYLDRGGCLYYIMEATVDTENLYDLLDEYGIQVAEGIVLEQDSSKIYTTSDGTSTPSYIIPTIEDTEITHELYQKGMALLFPVTKGLTIQSNGDDIVTGLVETSDYAYSKVNLNSDYLSREDDDIQGPFYLAALSETENKGTVIALATGNAMTDDVNSVVNGNNEDFFLNGINYLVGDADKISIRGKEITFDSNIYTSRQVLIFSALGIAGIPLVILVVGVIVVLLRRKRSQQFEKPEEKPDVKKEDIEVS